MSGETHRVGKKDRVGEKDRLKSAMRHLGDAARRELTDHPTAEDLTSYVHGELPAERVEALQDHLALCRECSALALDLESFPRVEDPTLAPRSTPETAAADWRALSSRLELGESQPSAGFRLPRGFELIAAALLLTTAAASLWAFSLQRQARELAEPRINVELIDLIPEQDAVRAGPREPTSATARGHRLLILHLPGQPPPYEDYSVEIVASMNATILWSHRGLVRHPDENFTLEIPSGFLAAGEHELVLYGLEKDRQVPLASYPLRIVP